MADEDVVGYAGDLTPIEAWEILKDEESAILVDVRTDAEWNYVGIVDLSSLNKEPSTISWVLFPDNSPNEKFVSGVEAICADKHTKVISICRSGVRSISSSIALTNAGFSQAYNVLEGFEGDKDGNDHRSTIGGWKMRGLPWKQ